MTAIAAPALATAPELERGDPAVAARQLEAFFVRQFLAMARPQSAGMLDGGFAGDTFHDMLDGAMADSIADAGGLGLASTFEAALGGEGAPPTVRPHGLAMADAIDAQRALAGGAGSRAAWADPAAGVLARPVAGRYSSGFGRRVDPMGAGQGFHSGLDIAAAKGTPVAAAAAGEVVHAGPAGGYGNLITLRHADGTETRYGHLSAIGVKVGDRVGAGAPIGLVGSTGRSTGPHLHFEVRRDGKAVDPRPYLDEPAGGGHRRDSTDRFSTAPPSIVGFDGRP